MMNGGSCITSSRTSFVHRITYKLSYKLMKTLVISLSPSFILYYGSLFN